MSFRSAYSDLKRGRVNYRQTLLRDKTPEEEKKAMDEYYKQIRTQTPANGRK